eukprot:s450_g12.t1
MGKWRISKKGDNPFALPKPKVPKKQLPGESEANRRKKEEARQKEAEAKAAKEKRKAEEAARPPGKKLGPFLGSGKARLEKRVQEGKITKTDQDVDELLQCKDEVVCALADVQDEAELRKKFGPSQGTSGYGKEFFESSCYRFRYMQAKDGTPVAQIYKIAKMASGISLSEVYWEVEDWINYHLAIGIEHFTVFDTDGSFEPYVRSYVDRGFVSYHPRFPKEVSSKLSLAATRASPRSERRQVLLEPHAIELCVWENRQVSDWVVVVHNMEEYLHSPFLGKGLPVVKLPEMIKTWASEVPSVAVFEIFQEPMGGAGMDEGSTIFSRWTHKRGLEFSEDASMKGAEEDAVHFQPFAFIVDPINVLQTAVHLAQARADDQAVVSISKDAVFEGF